MGLNRLKRHSARPIRCVQSGDIAAADVTLREVNLPAPAYKLFC